MCPRLTPAAFGAASCPAAGIVKAAARRKTTAMGAFMPDTVLSQRECVQRRPALDAHILLSIDHVTHGAGGNGWPEIGLPQEFAIAGIEGDKLAVAAAGEPHGRSGGEHAAFGRRS